MLACTPSVIRSCWTALLTCALLGCGSEGCDSPKGDVRRVVPQTAAGAVVIGPLEDTRQRASAFLAGVEGASGLLDLVMARYGVDLATSEGLEQAGLDPTRGAVVFIDDTTFGVGVGVVAPERFDTLLNRRARLVGATIERPQPGVSLARPAQSRDSALHLSWTVTSDAIGVLTAGRDPQRVSALLERMTTADGRFFQAPSHRPEWDGHEPAIWGVADWTPSVPLDSLPFIVRDAVRNSVASLGAWTAGVFIDGDKLAITARASGKNLPAQWFASSGASAAFEKVLPRHLTAALRLQTAVPDLARAVPSFVLERFLPAALPSVDGLPLPTPAQLLEVLNGQAVFAVLGLDDEALLTHLDPRRQRPETFFQRVHSAVGLGLRDVAKASDMVKLMASQAKERGFAVAPVGEDLEDLVGYSFVTRRPVRKGSRRSSQVARTYALILSKQHRALFGITGRGEVARFLKVARGQALPLAGVADGTQATSAQATAVDAAIRGQGVHIGAIATPTRIARELADKGVPPYFLKMMSDLFAVALSVEVAPVGLNATVELQL